jgi:two-component system chemotaxis sensor kinase CheA
MDHGIETVEQREQSGKDPEGNLILEAKHVGNEVWVSITDNGKGLDKERILQRAMEKNLITDQSVYNSDTDIWKLIFEPGFSTAEVVTDFSGRGVGMDVVRRNVEKLRGTIEIQSEKGKGSTFILKIPLTLSIIDGLLVSVGEIHYALPTTSIRETLQPKPGDIVKTMDGNELLRNRRKILPVIRLHKLYAINPVFMNLQEGMLLIIDHGDHQFALFVDTVIGQQQIVVKNLPESMANAPHLSGCTILGDGQVGLILDAASMAKSVIRQRRAL